jgi:hypothetical protein
VIHFDTDKKYYENTLSDTAYVCFMCVHRTWEFVMRYCPHMWVAIHGISRDPSEYSAASRLCSVLHSHMYMCEHMKLGMIFFKTQLLSDEVTLSIS